MPSALVGLLVGILLTVALLIFLANVIPVPAPNCPAAATTGGAATTMASAPPPGSQPPPPAATPAPAAAPAPSGGQQSLASGSVLNDGQAITSPSGQAAFTYKYGQVIVTSGTAQLWVSPNAPLLNGVVRLDNDGTLGLFSSQYSVTPVWNAKTTNSGTGPYKLTVLDDGNVLLFDSTPRVVWSAPISAPAATGPTYTPQNMWIGNKGSPIATGPLTACQQACSADTTCKGFSRGITVADADSGPCYKFLSADWSAPGAQQPSNTWKSFVKS